MRIEEHAERVGALRAQVDAVLEGVHGLTDSAREKLQTYQAMKRRTEGLLDEASREYDQADKLLRRAVVLSASMNKLRREQRKLDRAALDLDAEPEQLKDLRAELGKIGDEVHELRMYRGWAKPTAGTRLQG